MSSAFISIGSNLKDRNIFCRKGISSISKLPNTSIRKTSHFYETEPYGVKEKMDMFINAVIEIETDQTPQTLLENLLLIEKKFGRIRDDKRNSPRTLDLDLLLYNEQIINTEELIIPHPKMHLRRFVLEPLSEIAPDILHPTLQKRVSNLLKELVDDHKVVRQEN